MQLPDETNNHQDSHKLQSMHVPPPGSGLRDVITNTALPKRPGYGTIGRKMMVRANYFPIRIPEAFTVYHYDVTIGPGKLIKSVCRKVSPFLCVYVQTSLEGTYMTV